ncbi:TIGR02270 family protein [Geobacter sp.]|uniref:TIGR02270 family protein n=1 Tax=Geobacter sp. TaxID=46610 RepID=UPI0027BB0162|nr:TIGR02270 family protein [Geobacter sp.]
MNSTMTGILQQFADEAAFLWFLRAKVVHAPHFSLDDLDRFDERLEAQVDGLRVGEEASWEICRSQLGGGVVEGVFVPAVLAFDCGDNDRIHEVMETVGEDRAKAGAVISALGWLPFERAELHISRFLADESSFRRYIGIAAGAVHRHAPGRHLNKAVNDTFPPLIARGLRAYGELGRGGELNGLRLQDYLTDDDDEIRFCAAWSASLAGTGKAVEVLKSFVTPESPYSEKALDVSVRCMRCADALAWQRELAQSLATFRFATIGAGAAGDPVLIPWLIERMKTPALARVAGEAFTMITGVDIELEELSGTRPEGFNAGPNDDPKDHNVAMDADDDLPWPDTELIFEWWDKNSGRFPSGTRHLLGKPVSAESLRVILQVGLQRQRAAAALELALLNPGKPLFEVRAPASRQRQGISVL